MKEIEAIILAGGNGSRMKDSAVNRQKCLLPLDGKPVLGQIIDTLSSTFGSVDLKIGVAHQAAQVIDYVNKNKPKKTDVTYVSHVPGTEGWGIYRDMRDYIRGSFIAMPGDVIAFPEAYEQVIKDFETNDVDGVITLSPEIDVVDTHGVGQILQGQITDLQWPPPGEIQSGYSRDMTIWSSDRRFFDILDDYPSPKKSIGVVFMKAVQDRRPIAGNLYQGKWVHLGYPEDLQKSLSQ